MIDFATILFSTLMCLFVVFRAIKLDGQIPWFGKRPVEPPPAAPAGRDALFDEAWGAGSWADRNAP